MNLGVQNVLFLLQQHYDGKHPAWRCFCETCEWRRKQAALRDVNESLARQAEEANDAN